MSNKLEEEFNLYDFELDNFKRHFKKSTHEVSTDSKLSQIGKEEKISVLTTKFKADLDGLGSRFRKDYDPRIKRIDDNLNGNRPDIRINSIQRRLKKGEDISTDETNKLLIHELGENKRLMRKSNFQGMLSQATLEQLRKTSQAVIDSKDLERMEWLQEMTYLRGEEKLSGALTGHIDGLRTANLTDEQKNSKKVSERIKKGMKLFEYSIERAKTGEFKV